MTSNNLYKAEQAPDTGQAAETPGAEPKGGPSGQPRPGHKYVSRKWNGSSWDYEYRQEAHPKRHGLGMVHKEEEHTLDLPPGVGKDTHTEDQAYDLAVKHQLGRAGSMHDAIHPETGEKGRIRIAAPAVFGPGGEVVSNPTITFHRMPVAGGKGGKHGERVKDLRSYGAFEKWNSNQNVYSGASKAPVLDKEGNPIEGVQAAGRKKAPGELKSKYQNFRIPVDPKEFGMPGKPKIIWRATAEEAAATQARLKSNKARLANSANMPPVSHQLASGKSATDIVGTQSAPVVPGDKLGKVKLKFDSPEEEQQFVNKLFQENIQPFVANAKYLTKQISDNPKYAKLKDGAALDPAKIDALFGGPDVYAYSVNPSPEALSKLQLDPGSPAYKGVLRAAAGFDPTKGKNPGRYVAGGATTEALGQLFAESKAGADVASMKDMLAGSVASNTVGGGPGSEAGPQERMAAGTRIGDTEDSMLDYLDSEGDQESSGPDEEDAGITQEAITPWKQEQLNKLKEWSNSPMGQAAKPYVSRIQAAMENVNTPDDIYGMHQGLSDLADNIYRDPKVARQFKEQVIHQIKKSLEDLYKAIEIYEESQLLKGMFIGTVDGYSHREGSEDHPIFYFKDSIGNLKRYSNAPEGHKDYSKLMPPPLVHYTEPTMESNPEFFTQSGLKLTRAPFPNSQIQWNPNYHETDPENLWVGRWVNPVNGQHEFTYLEKDIINQPKLKINRQNAITDARLPLFRKYINELFHSVLVKDHVTGLALMLMDQGRMKPSEIASLAPSDLEVSGDLIRLGDRVIHADAKVQTALTSLMLRSAEGPLFDIPKQGAEGNMDPAYIRRIGPHYLINICNEFGIAPAALQTYQATQIYSQEIQKLLTVDNATLLVAHKFALLEVAQKMGYNLDVEPNVEQVLEIIQNTLVDAIVFEAIMENATNLNIDQGVTQLARTSYTAVPYVNSDLLERTSSEQEFSDWLHNYPVHKHAEDLSVMTKSIEYTGSENYDEVEGIPVVIEFNVGEKKHDKELKHPYGYIDIPVSGNDGEAIDVFIGPVQDPDYVFVIKKNKKPDYSYDEDKVMLGWGSEDAAKEAFLDYYEDPKILGNVIKIPLDKFKKDILDYTSSKNKVF